MCFAIAPPAWPLILPEYFHCSPCLHLLYCPSPSLSFRLCSHPLPPISRFPGRLGLLRMKKRSGSWVPLPDLSGFGFYRMLPGSPTTPPCPPPPTFPLGLLPSSVVPGSQGFSAVSLICLLIGRIKSLLFSKRNSPVLCRQHSFGIRMLY
jgi:hypothetical protein